MSSTQFLHGVEVVEVEDAIQPIATVKSSVIGIIGTAGKGSVNVPSLVTGNIRDGVNQFGVYANDGFTIPEALDAIFAQVGAMCIVVNVCDPTVHNTTVTDETQTFQYDNIAKTAFPYIDTLVLGTAFTATFTAVPGTSGGPNTITLPTGITAVTSVKSADGNTSYTLTTDYTVAGNVITFIAGHGPVSNGVQILALVAYTATVAVNVDYTVSPDSGQISRVVGGKIAPQASCSLSYGYVDPTKVLEADIVGGVEADGTYKGVYSFYSAETLWEVVPRILIAPHWTGSKADPITANPTVAELQGVAQRLRSIVFADGPNTTDEAVIAYRQDWGSDRIMVCDPWVKVPGPLGTGVSIPSSIVWAGITAQTDNAIGFWASPSNKILADVIGLDRTVEYSLGDPNCRANYLNSNDISTVIRKDGFRTWGNHSTTIDPNWSFLCVRRTADMIEESIMEAHLWAVDKVIDTNYFTEVVSAVNSYISYLRSLGAIYGGKAWADRSLNTDQVIASGQTYIDFDFTAPFPAEHITFRAHLVDDYIAEIFAGMAADLTTNVVASSTGATAQ